MRTLPENLESDAWEWRETRVVLVLQPGAVWKADVYETLRWPAALHEDD